MIEYNYCKIYLVPYKTITILIIHLKIAISSYEKEDGYEAGLKFIQDSLEVVKQHDQDLYESLKSELSLKIDSE